MIQAGWHQQSIRLVQAGEVDASAVDSHVLALARRDHPELAVGLRIIDSLGPSTIQPVVVVSWLAEGPKADLRSILLGLAAESRSAAGAGRPNDRAIRLTDTSINKATIRLPRVRQPLRGMHSTFLAGT